MSPMRCAICEACTRVRAIGIRPSLCTIPRHRNAG
jgi:hypothetical protein